MTRQGSRITRCIRSFGGGLALAVLLPLLAVAPASAAPAIIIDGTLTDLEAAIAANLGSSKGGNICQDALNEIGSAQCTYYVNGYDIDRFMILVDPLKNPDGSFTGEVDVYAGWDQVGIVGDVDGNGNPDTFQPGLSCASSDQAGIGAFESYVLDFDFDCNGEPDARLGVKGNQVINFLALAVVPGATFAASGDKLELRIPNLKANSGVSFDICDMQVSGGSFAEFDQLAEDDCAPPFRVAFDPKVEVTKTPETQNACPGAEVSWTITVKNTGPCNLDVVDVSDVLDVGMTYVSDDQGSAGDAQTRAWQFLNLAPGGTIVIHLTAQMAAECAAPTMNNTVTVTAQHNSACRTEPGTTGAQDVASVNCSLPQCSITGPSSVCTGGSAEFCGPDVAGLAYKWSTGATTRCITVSAASTYTLEVTDQNGCKSTCNKTLTIIDNPNCVITGPNSICEGGSAQFCGPDGAGLAYKWSNGATTKCITVAAAGTYTLEVTDQNGCKSTCQKSLVVVPPTPQQAEFCQGKSVEICGPEGEDNVYIWSTGASTRCITVTVAGTYTVTVNNGVNCVAKVVWTVTVNPSPTCAITGELEICEGASTELCGPDVAGLSYKWSTGATTRCITVSLAGIYTLEITDAKGCQSRCEVTVVTKPCGTNCPRTVGFWGQQCAQKSGGSTKFTKDQVTQIAACIDANSTAFSWGDDFGGFCANINPPRPMDCKKQAHRQFAALLANYCTGTLELIANNGAKISLDLNTPNPCKGSFPDAKNLGELIEDMDALLAQLDAENADAQDQRYCMISDCSDGINNGRGIPIDPACAEETSYKSGATSGDVSTSSGDNSISGATLELYRPTPNPFTGTTSIAYAVNASEGADVQIGIYNVAGRQMRSLVSGFQAAGRYQVSWDGRSDDGASATHGVYFLRAFVGGQRVDAVSRILYLR